MPRNKKSNAVDIRKTAIQKKQKIGGRTKPVPSRKILPAKPTHFSPIKKAFWNVLEQYPEIELSQEVDRVQDSSGERFNMLLSEENLWNVSDKIFIQKLNLL